MGNLAGADSICQQHADAEGLGGNWQALLSSGEYPNSIHARDRVQITHPLYNMRGQLIANSHADLWDDYIANPVQYNEKGLPVFADRTTVWTATAHDGYRYQPTCSDWTDNTGSNRRTNIGSALAVWKPWIDGGVFQQNFCTEMHSLYCVSDAIAFNPKPAVTEHRVFVTSQTYAADFGGYEQGDALCQTAAEQASLGGLWRSLVSVRNGSHPISAVNRITIFGDVRNMNNQLVATSKSDLFDQTIGSPINYDEFGVQVTGSFEVWTGSTASGQRYGNICSDWTTTSSGVTALTGRANGTNFTWLGWTTSGISCNQTARLYCLEQ